MVGREPELAELNRAWSDTVAGSGGLLVLDGEAGVGKTALAVELVNAVRDTDPLWVPCVEQPVPAPEGLLNALLDGAGRPARQAETGPDVDRRAVVMADALARALGDGARAPLLVVIDDVQWADEVSLRVLALAAPPLRDSRVLILATLRTGEARASARRAAIASLVRAARRLPVLPLGDAAASAIVDAAAPRTLPGRVRARVLARAGGNPLYLRELAILASTDPQDAGGAELPDTVRSVVERRLSAVDDATRAALRQLAVCGDDLGYPLAASVLRWRVDDVLDLAERGAAADVLQPVTLGRVRFTHPLVRDALAAALPFPRRVRLHQRIGEQLLALAESGTDVDVALIAGHLCAAAPAGNVAAAVTWAVRAADEASARLAHGAAADWYGRALAALAADPGVADRLELLLRHGEALDAAGDRAASASAYLEAFRVARTRGDAGGMGRAAIGLAGGTGFEISVGDEAHLAVLDEAVAAVGDSDPRLRAMLLARRSVAAALRESPAQRRSTVEEALALAREASDVAAQCAALAALCDVLAGPAHVEQRLELASEMARIAEAAHDVRALLLALRLIAVAELELGDVAAFDRTVDRYEAVAGAIREPLYDWYVPLWRGQRRAMAGDAPGARQLADRAEAIGLAATSENATILVGCLRSFLAVDTGDIARLTVPDAQMSRGMIEPWMEITTGYVAAARGDLETARRVADQLPHLLPRVPEDSEYLPTLAQAARTVAWIGGHPVAATLYDLLLPHRRRFVVEGIGAYVHGPVERYLGLLARTLRRPERAEHFAAARSLCSAAGAAMLVRLVDVESGTQATAPRTVATGVFRRDGEGWVVALDDIETHVADSKGMADLATLVAHPREEVAALRLAGRAGTASRGEAVLDDQARAAYRRRLSTIDTEIADAEAAGDHGRLERARFEREFLIAELTQAAGLGGRPRRMGDEVERARTAVTARLRDAIKRIERSSPALGEHFRRSVRTGAFCCYDPSVEVAWKV